MIKIFTNDMLEYLIHMYFIVCLVPLKKYILYYYTLQSHIDKEKSTI